MSLELEDQTAETAPISVPARVLRVLIRWYQAWSTTRAPHCRFTPSCSHYAYDAITTYGAVRGAWMAARRLLRCRPGGGFGYDPVPDPGRQDPAGFDRPMEVSSVR